MTTKVNDLITDAFTMAGLLGLGQSLEGDDVQTGLRVLNDLLVQWRIKRWLVFHLVNISVVSTGATTYSVGPGGDIELSSRPSSVEAAFVRQIQNAGIPVDQPLRVINAREEWDRIALKRLISFPQAVWLDPTWPLGTLYTYPIPTAALYSIHITVKAILDKFALTTQDVNMPEEYEPALKFNCARRLRFIYGKAMDPELNIVAKGSLDIIKAINTAIPEAKMPPGLAAGPGYNIYSDQGA